MITSILKTCPICSTNFASTNKTEEYCSDECLYVANHLRENRVVIKTDPTGNHVFVTQWVYKQRRRFVIFERDNFRCIYCGRSSVKDGVTLHCDHVIPKNHGGKDIASNLITSCNLCNVSKSDRDLTNPTEILEVIAERNLAHGIRPNLFVRELEEETTQM